MFRLRGAAAAGPGHRQDRRRGEVQVRGLAVAGGHTEPWIAPILGCDWLIAGAGEGKHVAGAVHEEQVWRGSDLGPARPDRGPLPARLLGEPAGGAGRVRHQRPQRVHVHPRAEGSSA